MNGSTKVTSEHRRRQAYLYVRQSSLKQVYEHRESTARQYDLRRRAEALGWATDQIVVIDEDQGLSGASSAERNGFQHLVAEVGLGRVGLVMGLEVSRLARSSTDWHRLLEICALSETLILDEDGIYDPGHFNDRLLLGLKGTMSEAELHVLRARLIGGQLNKARRGELWIRPPIGYVDDGERRLVLDPDEQIQAAVRLLFETFRTTGSAMRVVKHFAQHEIRWPRRLLHGPRAGEVLFAELEHSRVLNILHNPRYAGAYVYGRTRQRRRGTSGQLHYRRLPREEWTVFLLEAHPGYIGWEEYEANQARLRANAHSYGTDRRRSPPREGVALLQGLGALRPLWSADDRALSRQPGPSCSRVPLPTRRHPECHDSVSDGARGWRRSCGGATRARSGDTGVAGCRPGGLRRAAIPPGAARSAAAGAGRPGTPGRRARAAAIHAGTSREPARRRQPRTSLE